MSWNPESPRNKGRRKPPRYKVGEQLTGLEIKEVVRQDERLAAKDEYLVEFLCCGKRDILKHHSLVSRTSRKQERCGECEKKIKKEPQSTKQPTGCVDLNGWYWPSLA